MICRCAGSSKQAFTLAEVLITLGIIGIVATMTLPSIIQKQNQKEATSRLKKYYSVMSQAIMLSEVDNGSVQYWDKPDQIKNDDGSYNSAANDKLVEVFYDKYLAKYLKITSRGYFREDSRFRLYTKFPDGSMAWYGNGGCIDIVYDYNGAKKPNLLGYDRFSFLLCKDKNRRLQDLIFLKQRNHAMMQLKPVKQHHKNALAFFKTTTGNLNLIIHGLQSKSLLIKVDFLIIFFFPYKFCAMSLICC